ncbi:MAG: VOC family protein [Saprospiraceae bacterium]|nr:VOC family protein [Saprospiraceae bacterium]
MSIKSTAITPFLTVTKATDALSFYQRTFNASVLKRFDLEEGKLMANIAIDGADFWLGDEEPENGNFSPETVKGTPVRIILSTKNADVFFERAIQFGAQVICPMTTEEFWRIGKLKDPFGHVWEIGYPL